MPRKFKPLQRFEGTLDLCTVTAEKLFSFGENPLKVTQGAFVLQDFFLSFLLACQVVEIKGRTNYMWS